MDRFSACFQQESSIWVAQDLNEPTRYSPFLLQGGLGLPDREYYLAESPRMADARTAYLAHITNVLTLAGIADAGTKAAAIMALETNIAKVHATRADSEDVVKANNDWQGDEFSAKAPGLDWKSFFEGASLTHQQIFIVWQANAVIGEAALVGNTPLNVWKDYLTFHLLNHYSGLLPKAFADERFAFYRSNLFGVKQQPDRWKRAVAATNQALG